MADSLWMVNDDSDNSGAGSVGNLDPVARDGGFGRQKYGDGRDRVRTSSVGRRGIPVQLGDQEVVVLHPQRELLHVDVTYDPVGRAQQQQRAGSVVRRDWSGKFLLQVKNRW